MAHQVMSSVPDSVRLWHGSAIFIESALQMALFVFLKQGEGFEPSKDILSCQLGIELHLAILYLALADYLSLAKSD